MKSINHTFRFILPLLLSVLFISCEDKNVPPPNPQQGLAVETVEVTSAFNLSARNQWRLIVGKLSGDKITGYEYDYTIDGKQITATVPGNTPFRFAYGQKNSYGEPVIVFIAKNYGIRLRDVGIRIPNLENQSTPEKFMTCDPLIGKYEGEVVKDLRNIQFGHMNALLNFHVDGLPQDAKVYISMFDQLITPLRDSEDPTLYKAIVLPYVTLNTNDLCLYIKAGETTYEERIPDAGKRMPREEHVPSPTGNNTLDAGTVLSFTAHIDAANNLQIENVEKRSRTKVWPISQ